MVFIGGQLEISDISYRSQSYFVSPKRTKRNNSNKNILFNQTLKDIEINHRNLGFYDMDYYEFEQICRRSWEEDSKYLCIDIPKKGDHGRYCIYNESKNTYVECTPEAESF